jgi:hypothetical protein
MTNLFPAAQAVKDAVLALYKSDQPQIRDWGWQLDAPTVAAALRAAADQVAPEVYFSYTGHRDWDKGMEARNDAIREAILAIATELECSQ